MQPQEYNVVKSVLAILEGKTSASEITDTELAYMSARLETILEMNSEPGVDTITHKKAGLMERFLGDKDA